VAPVGSFELSCRLLQTGSLPSAWALGKAPIALDKGFVECRTRRRALGKEPVGKGFFAECQISGTRQRILSFLKKFLCLVPQSCTRQRIFLKNFFAEWQGSGTRQSWEIGYPALPSVALGKEGEMLFFCLFAFHQHKQRNHIYINTQHRIYHIHIHNPSHTHPPSIIHHIQIHRP
jgi:hypothetical protein